MMETMLGSSNKNTEEMLKRFRSSFPEEGGGDPEMVIEEIQRFLQERRQREKDQQEETRARALTIVKKRMVLRR